MSTFVDLRTAGQPTAARADICIVGAGAAGITLARYLGKHNVQVLLLESGGLTLEGETQSLYKAEQHGVKYYDLAACRLRYFGGTTNHWAGYCHPYTHNTYSGRPELGVPAWPIQEGEIKPYIDRAAQDLGFDTDSFSAAHEALKDGIDPQQLPDRSSKDIYTQVFQLTRKPRQGQIWRDHLAGLPNVQVLLHANVTRINLNKDGKRVTSLSVKSLGGQSFSVEATTFVLAAHAIENARLLLDSNDIVPTGIGNEHDHVGRYFMEHPKLISGRFFPNERFLRLYDGGTIHTLMRNANLGLTESCIKREGILDYYCRFLPVAEFEQTQDAARQLKAAFWKPADMKALKALGQVVGDIPGLYNYALSKWARVPITGSAFNLDHRIEQAPNRDSRITLSNERDVLGCRKVVLNWSFSDLDYKTYAKGQEILIKELTRLKLGTVVAPPLVPDVINSMVKGNNHHIGTARMSKDASDGVVDANLKVHGVENLYVAGSAVFPTSGHSVPTMIIMAFSIRLSDHLIRVHRRAA
ncbi:GMC family oxidoreductase [Aquabacterium sp.]|uniref:GMC family oxidoreductase n=1 Tax=Aquabacterium sp. TaxID=1872578 RepID=UPI002E2FC8FC|nr:GMC family oxidoreductase [Aquabacterium sp.]HEX5310242.1 GMC family oxidoreductase [Aquabacterium sp.]